MIARKRKAVRPFKAQFALSLLTAFKPPIYSDTGRCDSSIDAQVTRLPHWRCAEGPIGGGSSRLPDGTIMCSRARVGLGTGQLQRVQTAVEKLRASGRS